MRVYRPPVPDLLPVVINSGSYRHCPSLNKLEVHYPDARLVLDIPIHKQMNIFTKGLMVCSGVALGFVKDNNVFGMYLSHTLPHMARQAIDGVDIAISVASEEDYSVKFLAEISNAGVPGAAHNDSIHPALCELANQEVIDLESQKYAEVSDWYFTFDNGVFTAIRTSHCVPLALMNV